MNWLIPFILTCQILKVYLKDVLESPQCDLPITKPTENLDKLS